VAQEELEIEISAQGKVTIRTKGIKGSRCLDVAELFARIVGQEESRELTSEYYEVPVETQTHLQQKLRR
jgi:hypothetical protein